VFTLNPESRITLDQMKDLSWISSINEGRMVEHKKPSETILSHSISQSSKVGGKTKISEKEKTTIDSSDSSDSNPEVK